MPRDLRTHPRHVWVRVGLQDAQSVPYLHVDGTVRQAGQRAEAARVVTVRYRAVSDAADRGARSDALQVLGGIEAVYADAVAGRRRHDP